MKKRISNEIQFKKRRAYISGRNARYAGRKIASCRSKDPVVVREWKKGWRQMDKALKALGVA